MNVFKSSLVLLILTSVSIMAQDTLNTELLNNAPPSPENLNATVITPMSRLEFRLSLSILGFGLVVILLEIFLIKIRKINSEDTIKFITITLIIIATLFLITAGYSNDQIAPAVGLLGTIAGYLLGRIQNVNSKNGEK
ncbi:hypothetical protein RQM65_15690 [Pricia sp. S334]|uniref:Uncharacterized protein n=1 Tax=Pricia mediterranea TaxID=3076079 RepID=A0ABU3L8N9_9FLAO|nr:hypothetical protein [Pricia sp. S334]MDT7830110.1 hypothetical protein [Pricia sp. S334]